MRPDQELLTEALGSEPIACARVSTGGYTQSLTFRAETTDGLVFVKEATNPGALEMLRREAVVYEGVRAPFLPALAGFADRGDRALLAIEYLEDARWPPPYPDDVGPLVDTIARVGSARPPAELPSQGKWASRWEQVAEHPGPFLGLALCSHDWLHASLDELVAAESRAVFEGDELVHNDIYAANVAFAARGAVLVDWGAAVRGSRWIDVALAHLSVRVEGGPHLPTPPEAHPFVAAFAGHFAVEAPAPLPDWAAPGSTLREDMKGDLAHALAWCVEVLELPPLS